ncbi:putative protoporphyrinogen oxidase [Aspergillus heteromorphus CBS 117.55]|uniref:Protoporphyrinogen oxidase n=1 Tax=Aspergillus heteromorphus CBS 117.55 TaxID=1448321 RepID=A0A317VWQ1_9EURO|nr:putative protoporphyrinogen oxidase [Aspergillus heteromorphus CBS 117.55]PWY78205.1 putative protoporphyrinogen oxidase [Aspergillus heteromorphus CBS 117.55]
MRLLCAPSRAIRGVRPPLAFVSTGRRRALHTKPYDAAVIGGGITGLTAAYRLSKDPSCSKVTLYEKASRVGGWISSEKIPVPGGEVVFEYGPRTLKSSSMLCIPLIDLLVELDLMDDVKFVSRSSHAARNRYLYYPDHLVLAPTMDPKLSTLENLSHILPTLLREPVFKTLIWSIITEPFKDFRQGAKTLEDESVKDFISRRFSPELAENLVSALMGGIYAGNIDHLSAQAVLGSVRDFEENPEGILLTMLNQMQNKIFHSLMDNLLAIESMEPEKSSPYWQSLGSLWRGKSVLLFKDGMQRLPDTLAAKLKESDKVEILLDTEVSQVKQGPEQDLVITCGEEHRTHNRVIATHAPSALAQQLRSSVDGNVPHDTIDNLEQNNTATTMMVINLYYEQPDLVPMRGFGYLIPRSVPAQNNPEQALGVIFGSDSSVKQDNAPGTKLTVMMGGYWWDGRTDYPDHDTAVDMARSLLERHLGITDAPLLARTRLQQNAIPQYTVGHMSRLDELSQSVRRDFNKRLTLAGAWYSGVGVVDCIRQGTLAASYGVGARKLGPGENRAWMRYDWENWELEGGLVNAPVRWSPLERPEYARLM